MQVISRTESGEQKQVACAVVCGTFQFPEKDTTPMVLVGLGTGIVAWLCLTSQVMAKCCHYVIFLKRREFWPTFFLFATLSVKFSAGIWGSYPVLHAGDAWRNPISALLKSTIVHTLSKLSHDTVCSGEFRVVPPATAWEEDKLYKKKNGIPTGPMVVFYGCRHEQDSLS